MNFNLYFHDLKRNRRSFILWSFIIILFTQVCMIFYPILMQGEMVEQIKIVVENPYMSGLLKAFGTDGDKITDLLGFYTTYYGMYIVLFSCIYVSLLFSRIISEEERNKTADFLLSKPITRNEFVLTRLSSGMTYIFLINILMYTASIVALEIYRGESVYSITNFNVLSVYTLLLNITFAVIVLVVSLYMKRGKSLSGFSIGFVLFMYFLNNISKISEELSFIGYLSPFNYSRNDVLTDSYGIDLERILFFSIVITLCVILSFKHFSKKDILV